MPVLLLTAYIGRGNEEKLDLLEDGAVVDAYAVTRAVLRFGDYCLDTDDVGDEDLIALNANGQELSLHLGLIPGLEAGRYSGFLTLYDHVATDGIAWAQIDIVVDEWTACS